MNLKKIAAQYELMKLANSFQELVKKYAQEQPQPGQPQPGQAQPEQTSVTAVSDAAYKIILDTAMATRREIQDRYAITEVEKKTQYSLKKEFIKEYKSEWWGTGGVMSRGAGPTVDPYYPLEITYSADDSGIWTLGGKFYRDERRASTVTLNIKLKVVDPKVFIKNLAVNITALKNEIAATITNGLVKQGKLTKGQVVPADIVRINVNGTPV
jgi:hypothetical protein